MLKARKGTNMSREREIEKLQTELKYYKNHLLQCLLHTDAHKGEMEALASRLVAILRKLRIVYNIRI